MIYFFMLAILVGLIGVGVLALYVMDRVHKIEKQAVRTGAAGSASAASAASAAFGTTDPRFEGFGGQRLWELLTAPEGEVATPLNAQIRHLYTQVLQRHIEEVFEEGTLDGRQGVRMPPAAVRIIKTSGGQVASWLPPAESHAIYEIGLERSVSSGTGFSALRTRLEKVCIKLYEKAGIELMPQLFGHLLPGGGAASANQALPSIGQPDSAAGVGGGAEEKSGGSETVVEVIKKM